MCYSIGMLDVNDWKQRIEEKGRLLKRLAELEEIDNLEKEEWLKTFHSEDNIFDVVKKVKKKN